MLKRYRGIIRNCFAEELTYREHFIVMLLISVVYYIVLYFVWKAIYAGSGSSINGQTFADTFVNLALTSCLVQCLSSEIEWNIHFTILDGNIIIKMVRPLNYMMYMLSEKIGYVITHIITNGIPVFLVVMILFPGYLHPGWNIVMFVFCMCLSFLMMFCLEFMAGVFAFYTQSVWGISTIKNVVVGFFAGSNVPLSFFPEGLYRIAQILPFKSMYHEPLRMLMDTSMDAHAYIRVIGFQFGWCILLMAAAWILFKIMSKRLDINGG